MSNVVCPIYVNGMVSWNETKHIGLSNDRIESNGVTNIRLGDPTRMHYAGRP